MTNERTWSRDIARPDIGFRPEYELIDPQDLGLEFRTYSAHQLGGMEPLLSTRSDYVFETVGVYGVAESAALLAAQRAAGGEPELLVTKRKSARATCAIARAYPVER